MSFLNSLLKVFVGDKSKKDLKELDPVISQINFIEKWNANDTGSIKNFCNTLGALRRKGVIKNIKINEFQSRMEIIEEAKIL